MMQAARGQALPQGLQELPGCKQKASQEVLEMAARISAYAMEISGRFQEKLQPVCYVRPIKEVDSQSVPVRELPPFYGELRGYLFGVESALKSLEETIKNCEV